MTSRRLASVLAIALAAGAGCSPTPTLYTSQAGGYSVMMPGTPSVADQSMPTAVGTIVIHMATVRDLLGSEHAVSFADYPAGMVTPINRDAILNGATDGAIRGMSAQLQGATPATLGPHRGKEVRFVVKAGTAAEATGIGRIFLVGDRLYQILAVAPSSSFKADAATAFLDSFKLADGSTAPAASPAPSPTPIATAPSQPAPFVPAQAPAQNPVPAPAPAPFAGSWGTAEDPDRDGQIKQEGTTATITVPGTIHNLVVPPGKANAPRILRPADGDLFAEVRVAEAPKPTDPPAAGATVSFSGAGLLLWENRGHFIRLESAAVVREGQLRHYILWEHHIGGGMSETQSAQFDGGAVYLRLERRGDRVLGYYNPEGGRDWLPLQPITFSAPRTSVGVAAINTSSAPFTAQFQNFRAGKP